jgi:hypothetical protein
MRRFLTLVFCLSALAAAQTKASACCSSLRLRLFRQSARAFTARFDVCEDSLHRKQFRGSPQRRDLP